MEKSIKNKIVASILIFVLTIANFQGIITESIAVYASSIENQNKQTNHKNVEFNAQFMVINNEKKYSIRENISNNEIYVNLFAEIKEAGYLKSGKINIKDENFNNPNFQLIEIEEPNTIQNIDYKDMQITLNQLNNGEKLDVNIPIKLGAVEQFNINEFSKDTIVTFNGIYVDGKGEEKEVEKEIKLKAEWKEEVEAILSQETVKVLPYEKGIVISEKLTLGVKDTKLPIKIANLEIEVPKIEGILPADVRIEEINSSLNINKEYKNGKLTVTLESNVSENNTVNWSKELEQLDITYIFENLENTELQEVQTNAKLNIECYSSEKTVINTETTNTINITNKLGNSVEEQTNKTSEIIYKGNMLNTVNETEFTVESDINIAYEKLVEKVEVKYNKDRFVIDEEEPDANTYYKKLTVSKENFTKILGEDGQLKVYSGDTLLGTIDVTLADENENIEFIFNNNLVSEIRIETTKPIYSGMLKMKWLKAISGESTYTKEEIKSISHLKLSSVIEEDIKEKQIQMVNPTTRISLDTSTDILSTVVDNKGVEFTVTLNNNSLSSDLFENPNIEIRMPEAVKDVKINSVELVLEDELNVKDYTYVKETNSIIVSLEGVQTKYNLSLATDGANIIINSDITLDKLAVNKKDKLKLFVVNEMSTSYESVLEEKGYYEKDVNIVAPLGLVLFNSAQGYNEGEEVTSVSGSEVIAKIEAKAETKIATMKIMAINNYDSVINNIRILGRIPFIGNKSLVDGSDLGTTFDSILKEKMSSELVELDKFEVYYSENGEATEDLSVESNGWVLEPTDLSKIKSYLIVLKNHEMEIGDKVEFKYDIEVPAGLELGNSAHGTYIVYYDNKKDDISFENVSIPAVVEFTTGEAPKIEVSVSSNISEDEVARSGQIIKYTVNVKNVGEVDAMQVFVTADIPNELTYAELILGGNYEDNYYELHPERKVFNKLIGDLKVGQEENVEYLVRVNENVLDQKEIKTKAKVSAKNLPEMLESNEVKNLVTNGSMLIELKSSVKEDAKVKVEDNILYTAKITNISDYDITDAVAKVVVPEGLEYKNAYIKGSDKNASYSNNTKTIEWNLGRIEKGRYIEVAFELIAKANADVFVEATGKNVEIHKSNVLKFNICKPSIFVKQETTIPEGYVSSGDKIAYKIEVTNNGNLDAENVQIIDFIPEGMRYIETNYTVKGINKTIKNANSNEAKLELNIPSNETAIMNVMVKANETEKELKATNIVKVVNNGAELEANQITHTIEAKTLGNAQSGVSNIDMVNTYKVSGTAWLDKNTDGIKDNEEPVLAGITVMLLDKSTGQIAKDANSQELVTTTEGTGNYTFRNLKAGEYIVVFAYDTSKYDITDYKKQGVGENKNSDVVNMKIDINGEEKSVAVSDTLNISDENIYNINIGLKEIGGFDLRLDKYISKVTVKDSKGAKTYNYDNKKMTKIEVDSKTANGTTVIIEYKLVIKNEGSLAGYAKKIVDYMPKELKFSSELNSSWYLADDGNVYSSELASAKLNPGESKEVTLVLTKQITGENTGLVNNNAEIAESYNDHGTADVDSVAGNKKSGEDDMSNSDIYIGVKTGSPVTYIGLSIILMMVLALGAYLINTKILIKK